MAPEIQLEKKHIRFMFVNLTTARLEIGAIVSVCKGNGIQLKCQFLNRWAFSRMASFYYGTTAFGYCL